MFNKDFYPTPKNIIDLMLEGVSISGKNFLEPSAGKGDIVHYLNERGAKCVYAYEIEEDLRKIVSKDATMLGNDFLCAKSEDVSHVHYIVMNPPFSNATEHILHAWDIAPEGSEIISLCNSETLRKKYVSTKRERLNELVTDYGNTTELGNVFQEAERRTNVDVSMIHLYKPMISEGMDFNGFYLEEEEITDGIGILKHSELRNIVESYIKAVSCFDELIALRNKMSQYTKVTGFGKFGNGVSFHAAHNENVITKEDFAKCLQKHCWNKVFKMMNVEKFVTSGVKRDLNAFVESQTKIPFTMKNIYRMAEVIIGTSENTMNRAVVEAVDNFTKHIDGNRFCVEGWKTNSGHLLNKKFIVPYILEWQEWSDKLSLQYGGYTNYMRDLQKVLCYLKGVNFDTQQDLQDVFWNGDVVPGKWHSWSFFAIKGFKKGTLHVTFKDDKDWELLNRAYAKAKGSVLPEKI